MCTPVRPCARLSHGGSGTSQARQLAAAAVRLGKRVAQPRHVYCYFMHALRALRRVPINASRLRDEAALRRAGYVPSEERWPSGWQMGRQPPLRAWLSDLEYAVHDEP